MNGVFTSREPHLKHLLEITRGVMGNFPQWRVNFVDHNVNRQASHLVEQAFHNHAQEKMSREHLELRLLARVATLDDAHLEQLIDLAEKLERRD